MSRFDDEFWLGTGLSIPNIATFGGLSFLPTINAGVRPNIFADFVSSNYFAAGASDAGFAAWLTAIGGTYTRSGSANYHQNGLVVAAGTNVPRFPSDVNGVRSGLRLTGPATNLVVQSTTAAWTAQNTTKTINAAVAPDGTITASLVADTTAGFNFYYLNQLFTTVASSVYNVSAYVKYVAGSGIVWLLGDSSNIFCYFNLLTGKVGTATGWTNPSITPLANGWFRISASFVATGTSSATGVGMATADGVPEYTPGVAGSQQIQTWGGQGTLSNVERDYIATVAATAAQVADDLTFPFVQTTFSALVKHNGAPFDGTTTQRILDCTGEAPLAIASDTQFTTYNGAVLLNSPVGSSAKFPHNVMVAGNGSNTWITEDGAAPATAVEAILTTTPTIATVCSSSGTSNFAYGDIRQLVIWNGQVASTADMSRLTTIYPSWMPLAAATPASFLADFTSEGAANHYWLNGQQYNSFASWFSAIGGTITRASSATYYQGGVLKTAGVSTPRFPTAINGNPLGMRITGPGTNLLLQSNGLLTGSWPGSIGSISGVGPDGVSPAFAMNSGIGVTNAFSQSPGPGTGTPQTLSFFIKNNTAAGMNIGVFDNTGVAFVYLITVTWTAGVPVVSNGIGSPTSFVMPLANGWFRISITATATVAHDMAVICYPEASNGVVCTGLGNFFFGFQFENSTFATDYIPTTVATVTQSADVINIGNLSWANLASGSFIASGFGEDATGTDVFMAYNDVSNSYGVGSGFLVRVTSNTSYNAGGNGTSANVSVGPPISNFKTAGIYNIPTTLQRVVSGDGQNNENSTLDFTGVGSVNLAIGILQTSAPTQQFYGNMKVIAFYPLAASVVQANAILAAVT